MNNGTPDVSVIVPVYNVEHYIQHCLQSLVDQTCSCKYEIIVVNDGTKDNSMAIVHRFAKEYSFIKIIEQDNAGLSAARNTGIRNATGEFLVFVDSDDYVSPDYIKLLYESAVSNGSDVACCNYRNIVNENGTGVNNFLKHSTGVYSGEKILREVLQDITVRSYVWNKMYRRSIFTDNNLQFPVGVNFEDLAVTPQVFYYAKKVSFIPQALYYYVHREGSITGSISKRDIRNYLQAYSTLRKFMEEKNIYKKYKFTYCILSKKIGITIFGMLVRCWTREPKTTYVFKNYANSCKFLKYYSGKKYSSSSSKKLKVKIL